MHVRGAQYLRTHPSTADQEETPPKSAPARKKGLEVLGCAAQDEREMYVTPQCRQSASNSWFVMTMDWLKTERCAPRAGCTCE